MDLGHKSKRKFLEIQTIFGTDNQKDIIYLGPLTKDSSSGLRVITSALFYLYVELCRAMAPHLELKGYN